MGEVNAETPKEEPLYYRLVNSGSKQGSIFVCRVCAYSASNAATLKRHVRIHTGERPFMCYFCGNMFRLKHHLKQHMIVHQKQL